MHNMNKVKMLDFPQRGDERGHLVIIEGKQDTPFDIKLISDDDYSSVVCRRKE